MTGPVPVRTAIGPQPGDVRDQVLQVLDGPVPAPIVRAGHPVLRAVTQPYDGQLSAAELAALVEVMRTTMREAPGVGLAAPQIGISLALAVVEDPGPVDTEVATARERWPMAFRVLVNPRYEAVGVARAAFYEGCLSVHGWSAVTSRHRTVRLTATDETGSAVDEELTGWQARIVQRPARSVRSWPKSESRSSTRKSLSRSSVPRVASRSGRSDASSCVAPVGWISAIVRWS